ncbi:c-type cytochrome [Denitratisoma oestradiolicum]|nr:cytochrome c peroxidase [Denitratisoma oestradiolicum]
MKKLIIISLCSLFAGTALAAGNPCGKEQLTDSPTAMITRPANYKPAVGDAGLGKKLWMDTKLSTNGMSCNACHANHGAFQASFAKPYPHKVQMAQDRLGLKLVHLDEMIQGCMVMPMAAKPLPWDSKELAALVAYTQTLQKTFRPGTAMPGNPCAMKPANPCEMKAANPCARK